MAAAGIPVIYAVGATAVKISSAGTRHSARLIRNMGGGSVFLGGNDTVEADATNDLMGWELAAGEDFPDSISSGAIYAISASGTNDVMVWEVD